MKKIIFSLLTVGLLSSCDDGKLTNSKAEDLIEESLEENPKEIREPFTYLGENTYSFKDGINVDFNKAKEFEKAGIINIQLIDSSFAKWGKYWKKKYNFSLTDKAKPFISTVKNNDRLTSLIKGYGGDIKMLKLANLEVKEVKSVHEIPSMNMAEATVEFKKVNKNFLYDILSKDSTNIKTRKVVFLKTNDGWVLKQKN